MTSLTNTSRARERATPAPHGRLTVREYLEYQHQLVLPDDNALLRTESPIVSSCRGHSCQNHDSTMRFYDFTT
jgi:hypothetical protein